MSRAYDQQSEKSQTDDTGYKYTAMFWVSDRVQFWNKTSKSEMLNSKNECIMILWNIGNYSSNDTVQHLTDLGSSEHSRTHFFYHTTSTQLSIKLHYLQITVFIFILIDLLTLSPVIRHLPAQRDRCEHNNLPTSSTDDLAGLCIFSGHPV